MSLALQARIGALEARVTQLEGIVAKMIQSSSDESLRPENPETQPPPQPLIDTIRETLRLPKRG